MATHKNIAIAAQGELHDDLRLAIHDTKNEVSKTIRLGDLLNYVPGSKGVGFPVEEPKKYFEDTPPKESLWIRVKRLFIWI